MALSIRSALSLAAAALVLAHAAPAAAQDTIPQPEDFGGRGYAPLPAAEAEAVRAVARDYIAAAARRDGAAAARLVTRGTRGYYARMAAMAVTAPEAQVRAAPLMERMMILMYRHRVPAAELRAFSGDAAFAHTIDEGWVGEDAEASSALLAYDLYGAGDEAAFLDEEGGGVYFVKEDGGWRWDMMPTILAASTALAPPPDSGMTEDEFVLFVLKYSNGRDPSPTIWQPLP